MDLAAIRAAVATRLRTIEYTDGKALESTGYAPDAVNPPCGYVAGSTGTYDETLDSHAGAVLTVRLLTSRTEDRAGQELLDGMLADTGPASVKAALEAEPTLGGLVDDLQVSGWDGYRLYEVGGTDYYGAELTVTVLA